MPVTLSTTQPTDGQLRVITISWNMANKEPTQEDVQKILDTYPADMIADLIVVSCQEETRVRKNGLASKLIDSVKFTAHWENIIAKPITPSLAALLGKLLSLYSAISALPYNSTNTGILNLLCLTKAVSQPTSAFQIAHPSTSPISILNLKKMTAKPLN